MHHLSGSDAYLNLIEKVILAAVTEYAIEIPITAFCQLSAGFLY
jgi:hypothetical protein